MNFTPWHHGATHEIRYTMLLQTDTLWNSMHFLHEDGIHMMGAHLTSTEAAEGSCNRVILLILSLLL